MSIKITHPDGANATVSGIEFVGGVGEVKSLDDAARAVLTDHGFTFEETKAPRASNKSAKTPAPDAEAERLAALPIHVGDSVKLNEATLAELLELPDATPEALDKATAWRGVVTEVSHDDETDADVAVFDDETPPAPIASLEVAPAE